MSSEVISAGLAIVLAIIGLATLAVILSRNANTVGILSAGSSGLARDIAAATAPISGSGLGVLGATGGSYPEPIYG